MITRTSGNIVFSSIHIEHEMITHMSNIAFSSIHIQHHVVASN